MPEMKIIAHVYTDFTEKFGVPRQSGLVDTTARVLFVPEFQNADALRGIEGYSHLWLIWMFSLSAREGWSPTVRPPRLGGNTRVGVFASRSPYRPNPIALSSVKLERVELSREAGPVLFISGADMVNGSPVFDIKPYLPYTDSHPEATGGFTDSAGDFLLSVDFPKELLEKLPGRLRSEVMGVLSHDPRPSYQKDPDRVYGLAYGGFDLRFSVRDKVLSVVEVKKTGA